MKKTLLLSCAIAFSLLSFKGNGQDLKDHHLLFDAIVGLENLSLHNGKVYVEKHRVKGKKTKFFLEPDFVLGTIIFNEQPYYELPLKYNVYDDELLMQIDQRFGGNILQLHKKQVNSFQINGHFFIQINHSVLDTGFYEVLVKNSHFSLLKKHRKSLRQLLGENLVFYEFEDEEGYYLIQYKNAYYPIREVSDLISVFSQYETEIRSFEKEQKSNTPLGAKLLILLQNIQPMLSNEKNKLRGN